MKTRFQLRLGKLFFLAFFISLAFTTQVFAAAYYWDSTNSSCTGNWSNSHCWDDSGGAKLLSLPGSADDVVFNGTTAGNCTQDVGTTIYGMQSTATYTGTVTRTSTTTFTVSQDVTWRSGTLDMGTSGTFAVQDDLYVLGGNFDFPTAYTNVTGDVEITDTPTVNFNNGIFRLAGSSSATYEIYPALAESPYDLHVNKVNLTDTVTVAAYDFLATNDISISKGTVALAGSGRDVNADNDLIMNGADAKIALSVSSTIDVEGDLDFNAGEIAFTGTSSLDVNGELDMDGGTFDASATSGDLVFNSTMTISAGTFKCSTGTVSSTNGSLIVEGTATFNGSTAVNSALDILGFFELTSSNTFIAPRGTFNLGNNLTIASGSDYAHGNGELVLDYSGTTTRTIDVPAAGETFNDFTINYPGTNATLSTADTLSVSGRLTLADGEIDGTGQFYVSGDLRHEGDFNGGTLLVELASASAVTSVVTPDNDAGEGKVPPLKLSTANSSIGHSTGGLLHFTGDVTIDAGTLNVGANAAATSYNVVFSGDIQVNGGTLNMNVGTPAKSISVNGKLEGLGGTINLATHIFTFTDQVDLYEGSFNASSGTIAFTNTAPLNINNDSTGSYNNDAVFDISGAGVDLNADAIFGYAGSTGDLYFPDGIMTVGADITITGGEDFNTHTGSVIFDEALDSVIDLDSGEITMHNVTINKTNATNFVEISSNTLNIKNRLTLTNGLLNGETIMANDELSWGTGFDGGDGTLKIRTTTDEVIPNGAKIPSLIIDNTNKTDLIVSTGGTSPLYINNMQIAAGIDSGATFDNAGNASITYTGQFLMDNGTFNAGAYSSGQGIITFGEAFYIASGTFDAESSRIIANSSAQLRIYGGTLDTSSIESFTMNSVDNDSMDFDSGTFVAPTNGALMTLSGGLDQESGFTYTSGTESLKFVGTSEVEWDLGNLGTATYYNVEINKRGTLTLGDNQAITVNGTLTLTDGELLSNDVGTGGADSRIIANSRLTYGSGFDGYASGNPATLVIRTTTDETIPGGVITPHLEINSGNKSDIVVSTTGTGAITIPNLKMANSLTGNATFINSADVDLTITGTLIQDDGTLDLGSSSTHDIQSTVEITEGTMDFGSTTTTIAGKVDAQGGTLDLDRSTTIVNAELEINGGVVDASEANLHINNNTGLDLNSGTLTAPGSSDTFFVDGNWNQEAAATFNHNNGEVVFDTAYQDSIIQIADSEHFYDLRVYGAASDMVLEFGNDLNVDNNLVIRNGEFHSTAGSDIYIDGDWTVCPSSENIANCPIFPASIGTFVPSTGAVILGGTGQTVYGSNEHTFTDFTKIAATAETLTFEEGEEVKVTGILTLQGVSPIARLSLRSTTDGRYWFINPTGTRTIDYVDVRDSNNNSGTPIDVRTTGSLDSGHNIDWIFDDAPVVSNLGPTGLVDGSFTTDTTPTVTFDIDDPNNENVSYQIVLDDSSDFASPVVDYSSAFAVESPPSFSFTVGQAAGTGTYATGSQGQTLADGDYYWRARAVNDVSGLTGQWVEANSGAIAFKIDVNAPGVITQISPINNIGVLDPTPTFVWTDIADEDYYTIDVTLSSDDDYSNIIFTMDNIPQDSTSIESTQTLTPFQDYRWRIYATDAGGNSDPVAAGFGEEFHILNLVPEFSTYLYLAMFLMGASFIYFKRRELIN